MHRMHGWISRKDRHSISSEAVVRRADGSQLTVTLTDFSDEGCRVESADNGLRIGEWIEIAVPSEGEFKGQVRWALGTSAGVKFEQEES